MIRKPFASAALVAAVVLVGLRADPCAAQSQPGKLVVHVDQTKAKIDPMFYGLMTEEINYGYDGGLYAELIRNRTFREQPWQPRRPQGANGGNEPSSQPAAAPVPYWNAVTSGNARASIALDTSDPINNRALTTSLKLTIDAAGQGGRAGIANDGFWGIPVKPNTPYKASFYAKSDVAGRPLTVTIESSDGKTVYASGTVPSVGTTWQKYTLTLTTGAEVQPSAGFTVIPPTPEQVERWQATTRAAAAEPTTGPGNNGRGRFNPPPQPSGRVDTRFVISTDAPGSVSFNLVSLFPPTYKDRPNGMRPDLMQKLADMKPAFLRFPGGNYLEGPNFENRFNWKETIGPLEDRPGHQGPWSYRSSDGVGLLEFLEWCEDLNMEPLLAVYAGLHIDGGRNIITGDALKPHVQDALDEIEYVTGDVNTTWGARRAKDGHPAPFKLRYVEIGNEDWLNNGGPTYDARFTMFDDAIKAKYPDLKLIASGPDMVRTRKPDVVDEHYYMQVNQALTNPRRYANERAYPRDPNATKIFVGEWATRVGDPTAAFIAAMADAAYLCQLEQNADIISMTCYAPLLVNVNPGYPQYDGGPSYPRGQQWATDLIGYDSLNSFGSTAYYVQRMFNNNRGDVVLVHELIPQVTPPPMPQPPRRGPGGNGGPTTQPNPPAPMFASATREESSGDVLLKVVNYREVAQTLEVNLDGLTTVRSINGEQLSGEPTDVNSLAEPTKVAPKPITIQANGPTFTYEFPAHSVTVLRVKTR